MMEKVLRLLADQQRMLAPADGLSDLITEALPSEKDDGEMDEEELSAVQAAAGRTDGFLFPEKK